MCFCQLGKYLEVPLWASCLKNFQFRFKSIPLSIFFATPCILAPKSFKFKPNLQKNINLQTHTSHSSWDGYISFVRNKRISSKHSTNSWKTELRLRQVTLFHISSPWSMDFTSLREFWNRLCFSKLSQAYYCLLSVPHPNLKYVEMWHRFSESRKYCSPVINNFQVRHTRCVV